MSKPPGRWTAPSTPAVASSSRIRLRGPAQADWREGSGARRGHPLRRRVGCRDSCPSRGFSRALASLVELETPLRRVAALAAGGARRFHVATLLLAFAAAGLVHVPSATGHAAHCVEPPPADLTGERVRLVPRATMYLPVYVGSPPGDRKQVFVAERTGRIRVLVDGIPQETPFLDLSSFMEEGVDVLENERGFQSFAFHPQYRRNRRFYVSYTDAAGDIRVEEYRRHKRDPARASLRTRRRIFSQEHSRYPTHHGGQLAFGRDGRLYMSFGDAGNPRNGQHRNLYGTLLSVDPLARKRRVKVVARGLRNPYRFSFDRARGDMVLTDVGYDLYEDIMLIPRRKLKRRRPFNFGWPAWEGTHRDPRYSLASGATHTPPTLPLSHSEGFSAVVGGVVARDPGLPQLAGRYLFGDFCHGTIYSSLLSEPSAGARDEGIRLNWVTSFGEDGAGRIWVTSMRGGIYELQSATAAR